MRGQFLLDRIESTKALILAYEAAILALSTGAVQSYTIDTGQTRNVVTKMNLTELRKTLASLENTLTTLEARARGAALIARPGC